MEYQDYLEFTKKEEEETNKLLTKLQKKRPRNLDNVFQQAHDEAFEKVDCLKCANCCKTTSPIFRQADIVKIAKKFKMSIKEFEFQYLKKDSDGDFVLQSTPCTFLNADNSCFIYDIRPLACREYPHTNQKRVVQILNLTRENIKICPAVSLVVEKVKKEYN